MSTFTHYTTREERKLMEQTERDRTRSNRTVLIAGAFTLVLMLLPLAYMAARMDGLL